MDGTLGGTALLREGACRLIHHPNGLVGFVQAAHGCAHLVGEMAPGLVYLLGLALQRLCARSLASCETWRIDSVVTWASSSVLACRASSSR